MPDTATNTQTETGLSSSDQPIRAYYDRANPDLLNRLPLTAGKVLELGCGAGALAEAFRMRVPNVFYAGLELDPAAAKIAAERIDLVELFNADTDDIPESILAQAPFDAVVFGDVLEHLRDPWATVRRFAELLAPNGTMLACIPNVQNWKVLQTLMTEGFKFEDEGLFDRTHIRWFGLGNMVDLLRQAGIQPCEIWPRNVMTEGHDAFVRAITPSLPALGIKPDEFAQRTRALQYVLRGIKGTPPKRMLLQSMMLRPVGGVNDVRIGRPMAAMGSIPGIDIVTEVRTMKLLKKPEGQPKIFIWQRPVHRYIDARNILRAVENGYIVVTEFDDHTMRWPDVAKHEYLTLTGCHGVQTSTRYLADIFTEQQQAQPNDIRVFPNSIFNLPPRLNFRSPQRMSVFFGALNREKDWAAIIPGLNQAIRELDGEIDLHFSIVHDQAFFDALETSNKTFTPTCAYPQYLELMGQCEIALLPLEDNLFNRCKSDLKFIEAGAAGLAVIASPTVYQHTLKHNETGLLAEQAADFGTALVELARNRDKAKALGDQARAYVRDNRMMASQVQERLDWYRKLWDERHETTPRLIDYLKGIIGKIEDPDRL